MQGYDKGTIKHKLNVLESKLPSSGIANTDFISWYLFTSDNYLNYKTSITGSTTITFSELPVKTIFILAYIDGYGNSVHTLLRLQRKSTATIKLSTIYIFPGNSSTHLSDIVILPTDGNTIYCDAKVDNIDDFLILGYGVKQ
jgi:hypothetical protein